MRLDAARNMRRETMAPRAKGSSKRSGGTSGGVSRDVQTLLVKRQKALAALSDAEATVAAHHKALADIHTQLLSKAGTSQLLAMRDIIARW
jgi:hypothetical protein